MAGAANGELSTQAVDGRLQSGRRQGFARVAFTGGEPTVRLDLVRLVRSAAALGYTEIGITTNGRMLAVGNLADDLVRAGLNRVSFSLHGPEAVHDQLSGVAGAFRQLVAGAAAIRDAAGRSGSGVELHSVTLLLPQNVDLAGETVRTAAGLGARIHILQPFIASRPNVHVAAGCHVVLSRLAAAVAEAGRVAVTLGTRVKPYNIPYCELGDPSGLELQKYKLSTFRRQEERLDGLSGFGQRQFFRIDRCPTCPTPCPGYRVEQYPRLRMAGEIAQDVTGWRTREIVLPGLDLLDQESLGVCLATIRASGLDVVPVSGGRMWCEPERFVEAVSAAGVTQVIHVLRTEWDGRGADGTLPGEQEPGNEDALLHLAALLRESGIRNKLLVALPDLAAFPYPLEAALPFDGVVAAVPILWRGIEQAGSIGCLLDEVGPSALLAAGNLSRHLPLELATFDALRVLEAAGCRWQKAFAARFPSSDWSGRMARHRFSGPDHSYLFWSLLFFLY